MDIYVQLQCNGHGFSGSDSAIHSTFLSVSSARKVHSASKVLNTIQICTF